MAISTTTNTVLLAGNSSTVVFPYSFPFYQLTDLNVYLFDTLAGGITQQILNSNYSIAATADSTGIYPNGGNVIFASSVINTSIVVIDRQPLETQTFAILQNGFISSVGLTHQLDYLTLLIQDMADRISRSVAVPTGFGKTNTFNPQLPSNIGLSQFAGCFLGVNSTATGLGIINSSFIPYTPATSGYVLTGNGPNAFPSFNPIVLSGSSVSGTLSLGNGGTGGLVPSEWGVVYASSATQLATTAPGPTGFPLVANASSGPSYQRISYSLVGSGAISVGLGGTGLSSYVGNCLIQSGSGGTALAESPFIAIGSSLQFGDGSPSFPSMAFLKETGTGWARTGTNNPSLYIASSSPAFDIIKVSSGFNFGFGTAAATSPSNPFSANTTFNGISSFNYSNLSTGLSAVTQFYIGSGPSAGNGITIENQAYANTAYTGGGGLLSAGPNLSFLNVCAENTTGYITFNVYGRTLATERMRLTATNLILNGGNTLVLGGSGALALALTLPATMAARNGDMIYCGSGGVFAQLAVGSSGTILQSNGVGVSPGWVANGGLSNPMVSLGDTIYGGAGGTATRLAGITSNSSAIFVQTGSGGSSAAPAWIPLSPPKVTYLNTSGSSLTGTFTVPANCLALKVTVIGPGGGGGGTASSAAASGAGGGGGGGGAAIKWFSGSSLLSTFNYAVWSGAGSGAAGNNAGLAGSSCFFGNVIATGGLGGIGNAGTSTVVDITARGGVGGTGFGGDLNITGSPGGFGFVSGVADALGGIGGTSGLGFGTGAAPALDTSGGSAGTGYGGGGGGGSQMNNGGAEPGGSGANGVILVEQYFT